MADAYLSKPPAFPLYAKDFLLGIMSLSLAARGAYITFLVYQWDSGSVPNDKTDRQRILGCTSQEEASTWRLIHQKFVQGTDGAWRNARLESERRKQQEFRQERSDAGKSGASKRWGSR